MTGDIRNRAICIPISHGLTTPKRHSAPNFFQCTWKQYSLLDAAPTSSLGFAPVVLEPAAGSGRNETYRLRAKNCAQPPSRVQAHKTEDS
jgi:hypothetical protein